MSIASKTARSIMLNSNTSPIPVRGKSQKNIGKAKYISSELDLDDDDDGNNESYSIEPSVPLWKTINFKATKQMPNTMDSPVGGGSNSGSGKMYGSSSSPSVSAKNINNLINGSLNSLSSVSPMNKPAVSSLLSTRGSSSRSTNSNDNISRNVSSESNGNTPGRMVVQTSFSGSNPPSAMNSPIPAFTSSTSVVLQRMASGASPAAGVIDSESVSGLNLPGLVSTPPPVRARDSSASRIEVGNNQGTPMPTSSSGKHECSGADLLDRVADLAFEGNVPELPTPNPTQESAATPEPNVGIGLTQQASLGILPQAGIPSNSTPNNNPTPLTEEEERVLVQKTMSELESVHSEIMSGNAIADEASRAAAERDKLKAQLEIMAMQNEMLSNRMERSEAETKALLQQERSERLAIVKGLEGKNQALLSELHSTQRKAEADLLHEKQTLRAILLKMEQEKDELWQKVQQSEEKAANEAAALRMQREEYKLNFLRMENEKSSLEVMVKEKEAQAVHASEVVAKQLELQKKELLERVSALENEKGALTKDLALNEQIALEQQLVAAKKLEEEKTALNESLQKMEAEKVQLSQKLVETEKAAQAETAKVTQELAEEKADLKTNMDTILSEKVRLEEKLATTEASGCADLSAERIQLQELMKTINEQKDLLAMQLQAVENTTKERETSAAELIARERDELKQMVLRMKNELMEERQRAQEQLKQQMEAHHAGIGADPTKSLFELLEESNEGGLGAKKASVLHSLLPHNMGAIQEEGGADGSFMDYDEDADGHLDERDQFSELPAPHAAAASGDLQRLQMLSDVELALLGSFDSAHRSPLFYSVAYDKQDTIQFLLEKFPGMAKEPDDHGDTPLHAAVSADSIDSVNQLLKVLSEEGTDNLAAPVNQMQMTPAHLAASVDCLDALYKHGASLTATDQNGRSPLFVACAMNRWGCAEYLIECLDQETSSLYIQDDRGDTPLHAAACNGAVDCLLLMLQYGVDPTVTNSKGLKAIDLAIRNRQKKCQQLLAEYHLHYCTSSDFDSVLFLATLEGHKQAKNADTYEIVKKLKIEGDASASSNSNMKTLKDTQSFFSLKKNKTMRLQRWGAWIAYEDQETHEIYWYNQSTSSGQWEKPAEVEALQKSGANRPQAPALPADEAASSGGLKTLKSKMSMRLKKIGDWIHYMSEGGQPFYYNEKNGEFQFESPFSGSGNKLGTGVGVGLSKKNAEDHNPFSISDEDMSAKSSSNSVHKQPHTSSVPDISELDNKKDWKPYKDPDSGGLFWYNEATGISQWECPFDNQGDHSEMYDANGELREEQDHDHDASVVHDNDDLGI